METYWQLKPPFKTSGLLYEMESFDVEFIDSQILWPKCHSRDETSGTGMSRKLSNISPNKFMTSPAVSSSKEVWTPRAESEKIIQIPDSERFHTISVLKVKDDMKITMPTNLMSTMEKWANRADSSTKVCLCRMYSQLESTTYSVLIPWKTQTFKYYRAWPHRSSVQIKTSLNSAVKHHLKVTKC